MAPITCCSKNIDRSASRWTGLSVLFGPKGVALGSLAKGGSSLGLERPLPLGVSGGEDMEARFATAASLGFLVQVAHMRHRPACYLPIPFGGIVSWAHAATGPRHPRERRIENLSEGSRHAPDSAHPSQSGSCTELGRPSRTASTSGLSGPTPGHGIPRGRVCVDGPEPSIR